MATWTLAGTNGAWLASWFMWGTSRTPATVFYERIQEGWLKYDDAQPITFSSNMPGEVATDSALIALARKNALVQHMGQGHVASVAHARIAEPPSSYDEVPFISASSPRAAGSGLVSVDGSPNIEIGHTEPAEGVGACIDDPSGAEFSNGVPGLPRAAGLPMQRWFDGCWPTAADSVEAEHRPPSVAQRSGASPSVTEVDADYHAAQQALSVDPPHATVEPPGLSAVEGEPCHPTSGACGGASPLLAGLDADSPTAQPHLSVDSQLPTVDLRGLGREFDDAFLRALEDNATDARASVPAPPKATTSPTESLERNQSTTPTPAAGSHSGAPAAGKPLVSMEGTMAAELDGDFDRHVTELIETYTSASAGAVEEDCWRYLQALPLTDPVLDMFSADDVVHRFADAASAILGSTTNSHFACRTDMPFWRAGIYPLNVLAEALGRTTVMPAVWFCDNMVALLSGVMHSELSVEVEGIRLRSRYWVMGTGAPGTGKSPSLDMFADALVELMKGMPQMAPGGSDQRFHICEMATMAALCINMASTQGLHAIRVGGSQPAALVIPRQAFRSALAWGWLGRGIGEGGSPCTRRCTFSRYAQLGPPERHVQATWASTAPRRATCCVIHFLPRGNGIEASFRTGTASSILRKAAVSTGRRLWTRRSSWRQSPEVPKMTPRRGSLLPTCRTRMFLSSCWDNSKAFANGGHCRSPCRISA